LGGAGLGALMPGHGRGLLPIRSFAIAAVAGVVILQLLPEALTESGWMALVAFLGAVVLPPLLGRFAPQAGDHRRAVHFWGTELSFFGFVAHQWLESLALATYTGGEHAEHRHWGLIIAIAAHTLPLSAILVAEARTHRGFRSAVRRTAIILAATVAGFASASLMRDHGFDVHTPLAAALAGFLVHVVFHPQDASEPRPPWLATVDLAAIVLGLMLSGAGLLDHHAAAKSRELLQVASRLALATAPMLLLGLLLRIGIERLGDWIPTPLFTRGGPLRQAVRGLWFGAPPRLCGCSVLPIAESLRRRGAGTAMLVAFLFATPELGPETLLLTIRLLGWRMAALRLAGALVIAVLAGLVFAALTGDRQVSATSWNRLPRQPPSSSWRQRWADVHELMTHVAPWTVVGVLVAALIQVVIHDGGLDWFAARGLDVPFIAFVAIPTYVCPAAATPVAAALYMKGISSGAVLAGLLLGPATNLATIAILARTYGSRIAVMGIAVVVLVAILFGYIVNVMGIAITVPSTVTQVEHAHGVLSYACTFALAWLIAAEWWRKGLGPWLLVLGGGHANETHAGHAHDHNHGS